MTNTKFLIAIISILGSVFVLTFGHLAVATVYPSFDNETDCRMCHGSDVSNTHHQLVVNGTYQCTDCHPIIYDNTTQTYYPQVIRDCLICHPGKNHTQVHHYLVQQGLFQCSDCHPVIYDSSTQNYSVQVTWDCPVCHSGILSIQNTTNILPTPTPTPTPVNPIITNFAPSSPVVNIIGDSRTFNITINQIANVSWYINDSQVQFDENVTDSTYVNISASLGTWNVSAVASNNNGTIAYYWSWNISTVIIYPPKIMGYAPYPAGSTVIDYAEASRKFGIAIDQIANISWYINNNLVQFNENVTGSSYTNSTAGPGTYTVNVIASNSNGSISQSWIWNVLPPIPYIISFDPSLSAVSDYASGSRTFSIGTNRTGNISWYINGTLVQSDNSVTSSSLNFTNIPGIYLGTENVSAVWANNYGSDNHSWIWTVTAPVPYIIGFNPNLSIVNDTTGSSRNFSIGINQTANITWYINGSIIQTNNSVMGTTLSFPSIPRAYLGTSNVSVVAVNNYGTAVYSWIWNVTPSPNTPTGSHATINCYVCHIQNYIIKPEEAICYRCHSNSSNSANGTNIYRQFTLSNDTFAGLGTIKGYYPTVNTRHDITNSDQNYSSTKLECTDCHSAHNASRTNVLINPVNNTNFNRTMIHPGTKQVIIDYVTFCLECHNNIWPTNVTGPSFISNITYWYLMNTTRGDWHGNASGDKYNNSFLIGPYASQAGKNNVPPMPCNDCHDSHGSENLYHLKNLTDQYGVNYTITSANINSSDVDHWCSHCHKNPHQVSPNQINKTNLQNNCLSSYCHAHGNRF